MDTTIPSNLPAEDKETPTVKWNVSFRVKENVKNNDKILKKKFTNLGEILLLSFSSHFTSGFCTKPSKHAN